MYMKGKGFMVHRIIIYLNIAIFHYIYSIYTTKLFLSDVTKIVIDKYIKSLVIKYCCCPASLNV